jgi:putative transposase
MLKVQETIPETKVTRLCRLFDIPRNSFYFRSTRRDEEAVYATVEEVAATWPRFGYEGLRDQLRYEGIVDPWGRPIGDRRVRRILCEKGLLKKPHPRKVRTTDSGHDFARYPNLVKERQATHPDEIWASDITYIRLGSGFVYLAVVMDLFTRCIRGWHLSRRLDGTLCLTALKRALGQGRVPQVHHSDQGVQYAAKEYVALLTSHQVAVSMASVGCPEENGFAERWMRTIKEEHVTLSEYADFADARQQIGEFIEQVYQRKRVHSRLALPGERGDRRVALPPAVFEERWRALNVGNVGEEIASLPGSEKESLQFSLS